MESMLEISAVKMKRKANPKVKKARVSIRLDALIILYLLKNMQSK